MEKAAEIKMLAKGDPVPLDLLVRSNLVQAARTDQAGYQQHSPAKQDGERGNRCHAETP